ncbi:hypothetical protein HZA87_05925 [Candidatus Uhrbacteria bacterium]|nr:hypothetical protein [Candidatus Uhrbacteria bacterium]
MSKSVSLVFLVGVVLVSAWTSHVITTRTTPSVVSVQTVQNLGLATFSNGTTHVLFHDYDYALMDAGWDLTTTIPALSADDGRQLPVYVAPQVTFRGSNWQREVYTYSSEWDGCQKNILYINRDAKSSEVIQQISTAYCIDRTLDQQETTKFIGTSEDRKTMVIGSYVDGTIFAQTTLPDVDEDPGPGLFASNRDNTRLAFFTGACSLGGDSLQILYWDTQTGSLTDYRASLNLRDCGEPQGITYNSDTDSFDVYGSENGDRYVIGSIR